LKAETPPHPTHVRLFFDRRLLRLSRASLAAPRDARRSGRNTNYWSSAAAVRRVAGDLASVRPFETSC